MKHAYLRTIPKGIASSSLLPVAFGLGNVFGSGSQMFSSENTTSCLLPSVGLFILRGPLGRFAGVCLARFVRPPQQSLSTNCGTFCSTIRAGDIVPYISLLSNVLIRCLNVLPTKVWPNTYHNVQSPSQATTALQFQFRHDCAREIAHRTAGVYERGGSGQEWGR